jgi:AcrR family transcriptional regulator
MGSNAASDGSLHARIVDAALACIARWGIAKTTLDDVARRAGCSRATIYRTFEGGKSAVLHAVVQRELARAAEAVDAAVRNAASLEDLLVAGTLAVSRHVARHEALQFLLAHEPDAVVPQFSFRGYDRWFVASAGFAQPYLARFVPDDEAGPAAEWVVRVILSYTLHPSDHLDPTREIDARRLARTYLVPAIGTLPKPRTQRSPRSVASSRS